MESWGLTSSQVSIFCYLRQINMCHSAFAQIVLRRRPIFPYDFTYYDTAFSLKTLLFLSQSTFI